MTTHAEAREFARAALVSVFSSTSLGAERFLAAVAALETGYGRGWRGTGSGSFNMGAIQAGSSWTGATFVYTDTHPNADGSSTPYQIAFRKYATEAEGWEDLARVVYRNRGRATVLAAAQRNDSWGVSQELYRTGYYEGFGPTREDRIANHHAALVRNLAAADTAVAAKAGKEVRPTLRRGSGYDGRNTDYVREVQRAVSRAADGRFGPITEAAVKALQLDAGLVADGIVGPLTWAELTAREDAQ